MKIILVTLSTLLSFNLLASPLIFSCSSENAVTNEMRVGGSTQVIVDPRINSVAIVQQRAVVPNAEWEDSFKLEAISTFRYTADLESLEVTFVRGNETGVLIKNYYTKNGLIQEANICTQY